LSDSASLWCSGVEGESDILPESFTRMSFNNRATVDDAATVRLKVYRVGGWGWAGS